jgi:hypothetical protein
MALIEEERQALDRVVMTDVPLENVGPDPQAEDIAAMWKDTNYENDSPGPKDRDTTIRCYLCLDSYSKDDPAFKLSGCGHIVGKSCMQEWISAVSKRAIPAHNAVHPSFRLESIVLVQNSKKPDRLAFVSKL